MIRLWIETKKQELRIKSMFYSMILELADEKKEVIELVKNLYTTLKDVPMSELRTEFIHQLATIIHTQSAKERNNES